MATSPTQPRRCCSARPAHASRATTGDRKATSASWSAARPLLRSTFSAPTTQPPPRPAAAGRPAAGTVGRCHPARPPDVAPAARAAGGGGRRAGARAPPGRGLLRSASGGVLLPLLQHGPERGGPLPPQVQRRLVVPVAPDGAGVDQGPPPHVAPRGGGARQPLHDRHRRLSRRQHGCDQLAQAAGVAHPQQHLQQRVAAEADLPGAGPRVPHRSTLARRVVAGPADVFETSPKPRPAGKIATRGRIGGTLGRT